MAGRKKKDMAVPATRNVISVAFPQPLFEETLAAEKESGINRSELVRRAMASYLKQRKRERLEAELTAYFDANREKELALCEEFQHADADLADI